MFMKSFFNNKLKMDQKMVTNSTKILRYIALLLMGYVTFWASPQRLEAQCQMACIDKVNASIDPNTCEIVIRPRSMMSSTTACPLTGYQVTVQYLSETFGPMDSVKLSSVYIGRTVKVTITDPVTKNSCWGTLKIEDKSAPIIACKDTVPNVYCFQSTNITPATLGFNVQECSPYSWKAGGAPVVSNCVDVTVNGNPVKALKQVTQSWIATDANGMSSSCTVKYNILPVNKNQLVGPANDTVSCTNKNVTERDFPHPSVTGYPQINITGIPPVNIIPNTAILQQNCNLNSSFTDTEIKKGKVVRTWNVAGWTCTGVFDTTFSQLILILDTNLPSITASPALRTVTTSGHSCAANVRLSDLFNIVTQDSCSAVTVTAAIGAIGVVPINSTFSAPLGTHVITFTATDASGNTATVNVRLTVEDKTPPTAVCLATTVAITNDGSARLPAAHFNNGSKDECGGDLTFAIRRMDRKIFCGRDTMDALFRETVDFCCADVGNSVIVELRVTDASGNSNTCMVAVDVQNKLRPTLVCQALAYIQCNESPALDSVTLTRRFGAPEVRSICGAVQVRHSVTDKRTQCGIGDIERKWVLFSGGVRVDSCTQIIRSEAGKGTDLFFVGADTSSADDIVWPSAEVVISGCLNPSSPKLSPDSIGKPVILYDRFGCGVIAMTPSDEVFTINSPVSGSQNACLKILRTWKVIDWCQPASQGTPWIFKQVIKVINSTPPTVTSEARDTCLEIAGCSGTGKTTLTASATDDCSGILAWSYSIDAGNNGSFDITNAGSGNTINASNLDLPIGTHRIVYTFRDLCGNATSKEHIFRVKNCKPATPYLYEGLTIGIMKMGTGGMITTWASDFDKGSSHPCSTYKLYFAFSRNVLDTARTYTCADLGTKTVGIFVGIIVGPDTIWNTTNARLIIQDNNVPKACPTAALSARTVRGQLTTEIYSNLRGAEVILEGYEGKKIMSDKDGNFEFTTAVEGYDYIVKPTKNDDVDNGVNTIDLLMIQRHILNLQRLQSPYKMIAADINKDQKISVIDLSELRKVVLGSSTKFENNESWRFVDKNFRFSNAESALSELFAEQYDIKEIKDNMNGVDFMSIKVGDIDATAATSLLSSQLQSRVNNKLYLDILNKKVNAGEVITVPVSLSETSNLAGLQLGLIYNLDDLELIKSDIRVDQGLNAEVFNDLGKINLVWVNANATNVSEVVNLTFRVKKATNVSNAIQLSNFKSEAYTKEMETYDLVLRNNRDKQSVVTLFQNTPNPFALTTGITFYLPETMNAKMSIYDVQGRMVKQISAKYEQGLNQVNIDKGELGKAGIYYYTLEAGSTISTKKMVIID
jgi:hypothetical protein